MSEPRDLAGAVYDSTGQKLPVGITFPHSMTLRDWFAGQVLASLTPQRCDEDVMQMAVFAYNVAEAMMTERAKGEDDDVEGRVKYMEGVV